MKGGYLLPKGRKTWRIWIPWKSQTIYINKYLDGSPLYHPEQCQRVLERIRSEIDQGVFDPAYWGKDRTLRFERAWELYMEQSPCGESRAKDRQRIYEDFLLPYFKGKSLKEIEENHIRDWWDTIPKTYAPSYRRLIRATFRAFLNDNIITRRKALKFPTVKIPKKAIPWLSEQEQLKILESIPENHRGIIRFVQIFGCRPSEGCNLKKTDIDWEKKIITFSDRKNDEDNLLPMTPEIEAILKISSKVENLQYVFCRASGRPYNRQSLYNTWIQACKKAGVKPISLKHGTRHSKACQLLNEDIPIPMIARILGNTAGVVERSYGRYKTNSIAQTLHKGR